MGLSTALRKRFARAGSGVVAAAGVGVLAAFTALVPQDASGAAPQDSPQLSTAAPRAEWYGSVRWENDTFGGTDQFYTNGISLALLQSGPNWLDPLFGDCPWAQGLRTVGYDITQSMMTPQHTGREIPDPDDRPYAGLLTLGLTFHVEREDVYHGLRVMAGAVGPISMAEETQRIVHDLVNRPQPAGWDYQLENEPLLNLGYEHRRRYLLAGRPEGWALEGIPAAGVMLGNALTDASLGGEVRVGYNMPDNFGTTLVRRMGHLPPPRERAGADKWGFAVHTGGLATLVLWDVSLDGNVFEGGPDVDKKPFVPALSVGLTVVYDRLLASFSYLFWGKEFDGQEEHAEFGSVSLGYRF